MLTHFKVTQDHIKKGSLVISNLPMCRAINSALKTDKYLAAIQSGLLEIYAIKQKGIPVVFRQTLSEDQWYECYRFSMYRTMAMIEFELNIPYECLYQRESEDNVELMIAPIYQQANQGE